MPTNIEHPEKIDLITFDPVSGDYALIISTLGAWDDSEEEQTVLLQKINNYLNFVIDGELSRLYPQANGKPTRIQIDSTTAIPANIAKLVAQVKNLLLQHGMKLCVNLL